MAAFVGDECRSAYDPTDEESANFLYLYDEDPFPMIDGMSIYCNSNEYKVVTFKMYNHATGIEYTACTVTYKGEELEIRTGTGHEEGWKDPENPIFLNFTSPAGLYSVSLKEGTVDASNWTISPNMASAGTTVTATYSGTKKVKSVKAVKKAVAPEPVDNIVDLSKLKADYEAQDGNVLTGILAKELKISIAAGATVTLDNASINADGEWNYEKWAGITCLGDATIILLDGTTNTVRGFDRNYPGIFVPSGKTLIIKGGSEGTGSLTASPYDGGSGNNSWACGIGGGYEMNCGNIEIQSGIITAAGGDTAAGIGSGVRATCGTITISGGTVVATGGDDGAGIGSGYGGDCGNILISGGTVVATGGEKAAGIGSGYDQAKCSDITITGDETSVTATKGDMSPNSIGRGKDSSCGTVTLGGVVGAITASPYTYPSAFAEPSLADAFVNGNETVITFTSNYGNLILSSTYSNNSFGEVFTDGDLAGNVAHAGTSMAKDGDNLVINIAFDIAVLGSGSMTINTADNTYTWSNGDVGEMITLSAITIGENNITPLPTNAVPELKSEEIEINNTSGTYTSTNFTLTAAQTDYDDFLEYYFAFIDFNGGMTITSNNSKEIVKVEFSWDEYSLEGLSATNGTFTNNTTLENVNATTTTITCPSDGAELYSVKIYYYE